MSVNDVARSANNGVGDNVGTMMGAFDDGEVKADVVDVAA